MCADRVLVIRHGALGDLVQSMGPFQAIRAHHPDARITLLTAPAFAMFMQNCPWFDEVWQDRRPRWHQFPEWLRLRRRLAAGGFDRVYDLQTSSRSSLYFHAFGRHRRPEWSGIASGASHRHANPERDFMHTLDRQAEQLRIAGLASVPATDLSWVKADISHFDVHRPYALVVPGGSTHRRGKRWPADYYLALCQRLLASSLEPVLIGGADEVHLTRTLAERCPGARDLADRTSIEELAALARDAKLAVGNDTGPMHVAAAAACPALVLFSDQSDPALCAPRGVKVAILRESDLAALAVDRVWEAVEKL